MSVSERGTKGTTTISGLSGGNAATTPAGVTLGAAAGSISNQAISGNKWYWNFKTGRCKST